MRVVITGGSGLLGGNLSKMASDLHEVILTYNEHLVEIKGGNSLFLNLRTFDESDIINLRPDVVVHSAALTNVDYCEDHQNDAYAINVEATATIARACNHSGAKMIYISTDSVFDGNDDNYSEDDKTNPLNYYAKTKLNAEQKVADICDDYVIIRTNFYGWNILDKNSFAEWAINKLKKKEQLNAFEDIIFTPIFVNNLATAILELCKLDYIGVLHISGSEPCSKMGFIRTLADVFGYNPELIHPISVDDLGFKAKRPKDTSLNISKASDLLGTKLLDVRNGLIQMKQLRDASYYKELKAYAR
jgi:dTDP-4-dehydrorhamnose reductase